MHQIETISVHTWIIISSVAKQCLIGMICCQWVYLKHFYTWVFMEMSRSLVIPDSGTLSSAVLTGHFRIRKSNLNVPFCACNFISSCLWPGWVQMSKWPYLKLHWALYWLLQMYISIARLNSWDESCAAIEKAINSGDIRYIFRYLQIFVLCLLNIYNTYLSLTCRMGWIQSMSKTNGGNDEIGALHGSSTYTVSNLVKDLGVQTDNMFSPPAQCTEAANKARRLILMIRRSF